MSDLTKSHPANIRVQTTTEPPAASQWPTPRPMSEAPKDKGSKVLAWWPASTEWIVTWWWPERNCWLCALSECDEPQPTCWLPMPAAPGDTA